MSADSLGGSPPDGSSPAHDAALPLVVGPLPSPFDRRIVILPAGATRPYDDDEWRDAIVVVEQGAVELRCHAGGNRSFRAGDVLWMVGLSLVALHNPGPDELVLVAIRRTGTVDPDDPTEPVEPGG